MSTDQPQWLRVVLRKLSFLAVPHWAYILAGLPLIAMGLHYGLGIPLTRYAFIPQLVLEGEYWRLLALTSVWRSPFWLVFYVMYVFFVVDALESAWGEGPLSVFILLGYALGILTGFILMRSVPVWEFVMVNVSLAFGTLFPNVRLHLFLFLPVKAKWLALFSAAFVILSFTMGDLAHRLMLATVLLPYILFFTQPLLGTASSAYRDWRRRRNFYKHIK